MNTRWFSTNRGHILVLDAFKRVITDLRSSRILKRKRLFIWPILCSTKKKNYQTRGIQQSLKVSSWMQSGGGMKNNNCCFKNNEWISQEAVGTTFPHSTILDEYSFQTESCFARTHHVSFSYTQKRYDALTGVLIQFVVRSSFEIGCRECRVFVRK